jgi:hypothetical protein
MYDIRGVFSANRCFRSIAYTMVYPSIWVYIKRYSPYSLVLGIAFSSFYLFDVIG